MSADTFAETVSSRMKLLTASHTIRPTNQTMCDVTSPFDLSSGEFARQKREDDRFDRPCCLIDEEEHEGCRKTRTPYSWILCQVYLALSVSMSSFMIGFTSAYSSSAVVSLQKRTSSIGRISVQQASWIGSLMPLSAIFGALTSGVLLQKFGRRNTILYSGFPFLTAYLLLTYATSLVHIYAGRLLAGVCVGILSLSMPVYLAECVHAQIRGRLCLLPTTIGNCGILVCLLAGTQLEWNQLSVVGIVFSLLYMAMMVVLPDSPHWYLKSGKKIQAINSLRWLRGNCSSVYREMSEIEDNINLRANQPVTFKKLTQKRNLLPLIISLSLMFFQQMSGINAVIFYSNSIFITAGMAFNSGWCSVIIGVVNTLSTLMSNLLIDRCGRKPLLYVSGALISVSLLMLGLYFSLLDNFPSDVDSSEPTHLQSLSVQLKWTPLVCLVVFVVGFSLGWGPVPWLFLGEGLPNETRNLTGSMAASFNWVCTFAVTKLFQDLVDGTGMQSTFWIFAVVMFTSLLFVYKYLPETKGKTLECIEEIFNSK